MTYEPDDHEDRHHGEGPLDWYECSCEGCWACGGHEQGCTCDVDWDAIAEARLEELL